MLQLHGNVNNEGQRESRQTSLPELPETEPEKQSKNNLYQLHGGCRHAFGQSAANRWLLSGTCCNCCAASDLRGWILSILPSRDGASSPQAALCAILGYIGGSLLHSQRIVNRALPNKEQHGS